MKSIEWVLRRRLLSIKRAHTTCTYLAKCVDVSSVCEEEDLGVDRREFHTSVIDRLGFRFLSVF